MDTPILETGIIDVNFLWDKVPVIAIGETVCFNTFMCSPRTSTSTGTVRLKTVSNEMKMADFL